MIKLSGTLAIRSISGSRGQFNVGRLHTEIGEFAVKDSLIEEYEEGRYKGEFGISNIYPYTYLVGGRAVVEIRARLGSIALENIAALDTEDRAQPAEPDPIEETPAPAEKPAEPVVASVAPAEAPDIDFTDSEEAARSAEDLFEETMRNLFGESWPLSEKVKLDPTVDRGRFRQQRDALKELGYRFQPVGQAWVRDGQPA
jgi:hypothetical protein